MRTETPTAQQTDHGAALILGMILASVAAVAAGGWQLWQMKTGPPSVVSPTYQSAPPVAYPANRQSYNMQPYDMQPYGGTDAFGAPTVGVPVGYSPYSTTNNSAAATNDPYRGTTHQPAFDSNHYSQSAAPGP